MLPHHKKIKILWVFVTLFATVSMVAYLLLPLFL